MRRIAHIFPSRSWGGAEIYAVQLAAAQRDAGMNVVMWVPAESRMAQEAAALCLDVITDPVPWRWAPLQVPRLSAIVQRSRLDILHFHWSGGLWAFWGVGWFQKVKRVYHVHLWMKHSKKDPLHWFLYRSADLILVAGERARAQVLKLLPVRTKSVQVLPYAVDHSHVPAAESERAKLKADLGLKEGRMTFGIFARLDRQKGQGEFLDAFEKFLTTEKGKTASSQLLLVGDPTHGEASSVAFASSVLQRIKKFPLEAHVIHVPSTSAFLNYLDLCDVLVVPSYHESYSLMILHAFFGSVPVMASDSGGTPDLVDESRGWLFAPEDAEAIYQVLRTLSLESILRKKTTLKQYVEGRHTFPAVVSKLSEFYNGAISD